MRPTSRTGCMTWTPRSYDISSCAAARRFGGAGADTGTACGSTLSSHVPQQRAMVRLSQVCGGTVAAALGDPASKHLKRYKKAHSSSNGICVPVFCGYSCVPEPARLPALLGTPPASRISRNSCAFWWPAHSFDVAATAITDAIRDYWLWFPK